MLKQLSKVKQLLISHTAFEIGKSVYYVFMDAFIWRLTDDIRMVAIFNIIYILSHTITFASFANALNNGMTHRVRKLGLIGFSLVYLFLFLFKSEIVGFLNIFALLIGVFNGMYWLPYQFNRFNLTKIKNRGKYSGYEASARTTVKILTPALGGYVISLLPGLSGYNILFLLGVIFFWLCFISGNIKIKNASGTQVKWYKSIRTIIKYPKVIKVVLAAMLGGFSINGSLIRVVVPLLILTKTGTEFQMGGWLSFFALLAVIASIIIGKKISYKHYDELTVIGGVVFILLFFLVYKFPTLPIIILFGAVQKVTAHMINIPRRVYSENLLHVVKNYKRHRTGFLVIREIFNVGFGRTASYALLLFAGDLSIRNLTFYSALIILAVIIQVWFLASIRYKHVKFEMEAIEE